MNYMVKTLDGSWEEATSKSKQGSNHNEMDRSCAEGRRWNIIRQVPTCTQGSVGGLVYSEATAGGKAIIVCFRGRSAREET